jgi:hypothetical protein
MDFFRLATQSGAKYEPETQRFQMGPAEAATFGMLQQQEKENEDFFNSLGNDSNDRF